MKKYIKIISFILSVIIISSTLLVPAFASNEISVYMDNEKIKFDVAPILVNGRTMVPLRAIFEKLGATVDWDNATRTAIAKKGNVSVSIAINDSTLYKNGNPVTLDVPAQLKGGRTLVPLRAVSEAFACDVQWNGETRTVDIFTSKSSLTKKEAMDKLSNWIKNNYNYSFVAGAEYISYEKKKGVSSFRVSPTQDSRNVTVTYNKVTSKELTTFTFYLSDARFIVIGGPSNGYTSAEGNIVKLASSNALDLTYSSYKSDYTGNKDVILGSFDKLAEDTLVLFDNFLKEINIGLRLKDFGLDYDLPEKSKEQDFVFDILKDFVLVRQNDTINDKPVYSNTYNNSNGSSQYSIQYNDKNDTIKLTIRTILNNAWMYTHTTLTRKDQTYHCSFSYYSPSNKSSTPDFDAAYTIDAGSFGENSNINFTNIKGNKKNLDLYKKMTRLMNLEMIRYTDSVLKNILDSYGCSMADFGFNSK